MTEPDAELVARIQSGDAAAFATLMRRHFRMAFLIAYAQLGNRADAEDVCQDAFVRCWERILDGRDPSRVGRWIASIVRNTARNRREYLAIRDAVPLDAALAGTGRRPTQTPSAGICASSWPRRYGRSPRCRRARAEQHQIGRLTDAPAMTHLPGRVLRRPRNARESRYAAPLRGVRQFIAGRRRVDAQSRRYRLMSV